MARPKSTTRQALVDAAVLLFMRQGYQNTTVDEIAEKVGISKQTVYQYIKTKGSLLESIFETVTARLDRDQDRIMTDVNDPALQLRETIRFYVDAVAELQPYFHIFYGEEAELPKRTLKRVRQLGRQRTDRLTALLQACADRGHVRGDVDPHVAALLLSGMLTSVHRWYDPAGAMTTGEIAAQATAMLEGYLITCPTAATTRGRTGGSPARATA